VLGSTSELKMPETLLLDLAAFLYWTSLDVLLVGDTGIEPVTPAV
jgi:hypothetical protein